MRRAISAKRIERLCKGESSATAGAAGFLGTGGFLILGFGFIVSLDIDYLLLTISRENPRGFSFFMRGMRGDLTKRLKLLFYFENIPLSQVKTVTYKNSHNKKIELIAIKYI